MFEVHSFINSPVTSNCYVLFDRDLGNECIIVDPGSRSEKELIDYLVGESLAPEFIILTHEHFDYCWGVNQLVDHYHIPVVCSEICADAIKYEKRNCSVFYDNKEGFTINCEAISIESLDNELLSGVYGIRFCNTPGHTDASISFVIGKCLFAGDTLIKDQKTVTKLPTGSVNSLRETMDLYKRLVHKNYTVFPGHGDIFFLEDFNFDNVI